MELGIDMYIRYKTISDQTLIAQLKGYSDSEILGKYKIKPHKNSKGFLYANEILKASHNIIDLIEVGDYVNGKEVIDTSYKESIGLLDFEKMETNSNYIEEEEIKSIVTKEQFKRCEYKI